MSRPLSFLRRVQRIWPSSRVTKNHHHYGMQRRVTAIHLASTSSTRFTTRRSFTKSFTAKDPDRVKIGHVEIPIHRPSKDDVDLVPRHYLSNSSLEYSSTSFLRHLQWMMAKDLLGQDMLLVGPPGAGSAYRRRLVLAYAELVQKPVEILTLGSDLTESDLKQRRELVTTTFTNSTTSSPNTSTTTTVQFRDQAPVRAAKHGRLLILDGLERAERNVLPSLNNLLENREMHLEDGTFLVSPKRYQQLDNADSNFLIPVHKDFRVIALGVPTPPFPGRTLDPPIRSRFQIRRVDPPNSQEMYQELLLLGDNATVEEEEEVAKFCATFGAAMMQESTNEASPSTSIIPSFPFTSLPSIAESFRRFPNLPRHDILLRAYPFATTDERIQDVFGSHHKNDETRTGFWTAIRALHQTNKKVDDKAKQNYSLAAIEKIHDSVAEISFCSGDADMDAAAAATVKFPAPCGRWPVNHKRPTFVETEGSYQTITAMMQEHIAGRDILLVAPKGEGKSATTLQFASLLGYETPQLFALFSEMTSQDLLLRRVTDPKTGQTQWEPSPLLRAAGDGNVCILDGVEKLRPDVLSSLQSLLLDRDIALPDGRRALRSERILPNTSPEAVLAVHPSFRVVALASVKRDGSASRWMTPDLTSMFSTLILPAPSADCQRAILHASNPDCSEEAVSSLLAFQSRLTDTVAEDCGVAPLSTRNMIRAIRKMGKDSSSNRLWSILSSILLLNLLPPSQRAVLESVMEDSGIAREESSQTSLADGVGTHEKKIIVDDEWASVGSLKIERRPPSRPEMVPSTKAFFEIPCHVDTMEDLLIDWSSGERAFLLLGNQGVGKNMITDRICEIANWEREYIQLHRDSTIGQLTLTPTLEDGRVIWKDSPLVRAVSDGSVLVVDEADKAPIEVVSVLKGLVEDGELLLADGRIISRFQDGPGYIKMHPNFSLWVLANRPGFPFQGNDFFREVGDCFSTRVIDNPDLESETLLLRSFGPSVDESVLGSVVTSFAELRDLADRGEISYPYSTRESVAVVKHLEKFPQDGVVEALHNVLDFDSFDETTYSTLGSVFKRHGIPVTGYSRWSEAMQRAAEKGNLKIEFLGGRGAEGKSSNPPELDLPKRGKWDDKNEAHVGGNQWAGGTGGSDTAGLGGRGGPYRLDRGHKVHQVSDEAKAEVSAEAAAIAREMGRKALAERLEEIGMTEDLYQQYQHFRDPVSGDIERLRSILKSTISRAEERGWLKRQSHGELDDNRLVHGLTGDKYIFKRRGVLDDDTSQKVKKFRFVMDCSASMYRFNGYDERLSRCLEAALLVMEGFQGAETKYDYSIVGHSGDSACLPFVEFGDHPANEADRVRVLQRMVAHSQFCQSGDYTLEAMHEAIVDIQDQATQDDDCIVIGVSDANLARYGIEPRDLGRIMEEGEKSGVKAFAIFIASFGQEAESIQRSLPKGRGHICFQTSDLPKVVRDILTSHMRR